MAKNLIEAATSLESLMKELEPIEIYREMRNASARVGRSIRKQAVESFKSKASGIESVDELADNVVLTNYRKAFGFHVTVLKRAKNGSHSKTDHLNRHGLWKPVLQWLQGGTAQRATRKGGYNRGRITPLHFMDPLTAKVDQGAKLLEADLDKHIDKIIKRHNNRL